jgi:UDP-N-acetylglucosamine--N-acetylmuramyl-(pentapeptide) pyrophosphoryl-undecaprenol N-acetylglucosamine transferase
VTVTFAGSPDRVEARLVPERGYAFDAFRVVGFPRRPGPRLARSLAIAVTAPAACLHILARRRPHVVLGGGGYVAGPMVLAAWLRRIPAALTEADAHLGLANRLAAPLARRVFLAFPVAGRSGTKYRVTGRPIPKRSVGGPREQARRLFELPKDGPVLLVFGGSLGARTLNEAAIEAFGESAPCAVLHASGRRDYDQLLAKLEALGSPSHYHLHSYIEPFADALAAADLAAARAGGSVLELAVAGLPALLVPYPHATADHQTRNARWMEQAGAAVVVPDTELDGPRLAREVAALLGAPARLRAMSAAASRVSRPDAAAFIAHETLAVARGPGRGRRARRSG